MTSIAGLAHNYANRMSAQWPLIPCNSLTRDLHRSLYREVVRAFIVYRQLPSNFRPLPFTFFGSLLVWFGRDSLLSLRSRSNNPGLRDLLTIALSLVENGA